MPTFVCVRCETAQESAERQRHRLSVKAAMWVAAVGQGPLPLVAESGICSYIQLMFATMTWPDRLYFVSFRNTAANDPHPTEGSGYELFMCNKLLCEHIVMIL
jgi:hypothetical protein